MKWVGVFDSWSVTDIAPGVLGSLTSSAALASAAKPARSAERVSELCSKVHAGTAMHALTRRPAALTSNERGPCCRALPLLLLRRRLRQVHQVAGSWHRHFGSRQPGHGGQAAREPAQRHQRSLVSVQVAAERRGATVSACSFPRTQRPKPSALPIGHRVPCWQQDRCPSWWGQSWVRTGI